VLTEAIKLCDIFLPSLEDIEQLVGIRDPRAIVDWACQHGASAVVLKLGAAGCLISDGTTCTSIPAKPVQAVDATGAGDCFCGNLLARLAAGDLLLDAARYANAAAALAVQGFGAVAPLPTRDQVVATL
jgi:2-dehydro-3-deoxygluconokinase